VYPGAPDGTPPQGERWVSRVPYDWRSPVTYASDLTARTDVKLLLIQGGADALIEPSQACELAYRVGDFTNVQVGNNELSNLGTFSAQVITGPPGGADPMAPTGCDPHQTGVQNPSLPQYLLQWQPHGSPMSNPIGIWPSRRYLLVFDGAQHADVVDDNQLAYHVFKDWASHAFQ
jgi:hypothetical protein